MFGFQMIQTTNKTMKGENKLSPPVVSLFSTFFDVQSKQVFFFFYFYHNNISSLKKKRKKKRKGVGEKASGINQNTHRTHANALQKRRMFDVLIVLVALAQVDQAAWASREVCKE